MKNKPNSKGKCCSGLDPSMPANAAGMHIADSTYRADKRQWKKSLPQNQSPVKAPSNFQAQPKAQYFPG